MSERQILITYDQPIWDEEDHDWLMERLSGILSGLLTQEDYTIQEFEK